MTITELIELLENHLERFGNLEITGFIGITIKNNKLEIESESIDYKELTTENLKSISKLLNL